MRVLLEIIYNILKGILFFFMYMLFFSCEKESNSVFVDELDEEYQLYDYYVDECGNEGVVAYIRNSSSIIEYPKGYKYIIVLSLDESFEPWGPMGEIVMKKDSVSSSDLRQSTSGIIMLQCMNSRGIERYPAQCWCFNKNQSKEIGTSSWRLPNINELRQIFGTIGKNVPYLNQAIKSYGGTLIDDNRSYWTCIENYGYTTYSEQDSDYDQANRAITISPHASTSEDKDIRLKKNSYYVRAIRYIYYYDYE